MASSENAPQEALLECPSCKARARAPSHLRGKTVACRKCGATFLVQSSSGPGTSPPRTPTPDENEIFGGGSSSFIGEMAEKFGYVTAEQVREALEQQRRMEQSGGERILLGQLLVQRGLITEEQLDLILLLQKMKQTRSDDRAFCELAVERGFATEEEVQEALGIQRKTFVESKTVALAGDILVEQAVLTREQRDTILRTQGRLEKPLANKGDSQNEADDASAQDERPEPALVVSEDHMAVSLQLESIDPALVTIQKVKELLSSHQVEFGILPDDEIRHNLEEAGEEPASILVAKGEEPRAGQDAKITYFFDTDPLKIGTLTRGGTIDFRDRGEIPHVVTGTLLAGKKPPVPGKPGRDVFSKVIPASKPKDVKLRCGKGASRSEDGLEVHAAMDGEPVVSPDGKISVLPNRKIQGDVDLKTGHVEFEGGIDVTGSVRDGFRVRGGRLAAHEILRADIRVSGDIVVRGGIIGATIRGDGNLKAKYVQNARILVLGDVAVEKEVLDSEIVTSGAFLMPAGTILNSRISAKKGVDAAQIGSNESKPCRLQVGIDEGALTQIRELEQRKKKNLEKRDKYMRAAGKLQDFASAMLPEITELAQVQDRGTLRRKELEETLAPGQAEGRKEETAKLRLEIEALEEKIQGAAARLEKLMDLQDRIVAKCEALENRAGEMDAENQALDEDIEGIEEWSRSSVGAALVKVRRKIFPNTEIKGPHGLVRLRVGQENCMIQEKRVAGPEDQEPAWKMRVSGLNI
ncbi:MAG: DUF342 domain-containing protein [Deltaproteobacteria bacterium]|nr:DUF342 domain-containing protein [Deltaproteobacteria bacterium]MBW1922952.1 DUF342 domain-containing protein [Deltaproteobacteria bacterium]MBW2008529.1 DUF342 domain-containing protein [Deltaproteobacteria bacterium]MBW2101621.1 DUF342 domain-containing protein [Deltaproteobacteria bacterium]MBW2347016.1 DUF342 domain-containing protein [Deltaproteobacteria bacterium]